MSDQVLTHKWEEAGLGEAPFRAVALISTPSKSLCEANPDAYNNAFASAQATARRFGVSLCICDACGQSLMNNVVIRDARGKHFVVGLDCAGKAGDTKVISQAEKMERARQKAIRDARREADRLARQAAYEAELQAQRDRNGGPTDAQLERQRRDEEERAAAEKHSAENAWLIDVLRRTHQGDFVASIIEQLERQPLREAVRGRAADIVGEIYGKTAGGRRGSKKYEAAEEEFWGKYNGETK